jgi:fibronectin-binding autotransporter adhesin
MLKNIRIAAAVAVSSLALIGGANKAHAHATSIGYENAGATGSILVWLGTYGHGGHHLEGSMNLVGANGNPFASTTVAFTVGAGVGPAPFNNTPKPAGLIDGVTNFYGCNTSGALTSTCVGDSSSFAGPDHWQGALFTGLAAGDYKFTYVPIVNPTAEWSILNPNMNGIFTITGSVINPNPVPEPTILSMLGLGLIGAVVTVRRRKQKA